MFARFRSFMQEAVDVVAPQVKSRSDALVDHWNFVAGYFDGTRELPAHIDETNISFHLVSIIKYIKEEEVEESETESGLTGPCMEELLHRKMPDALVSWAIEDRLPGMYVQVLKTFSLLISNIHHRLLPEATVRLPLDQLITHAHSLEEHGDDLKKIKYELMKLINVVCRQFKLNPPLLNLFIEEVGLKNDKEVIKIPLLDISSKYVIDYDLESLHIARESLLLLFPLIFRDEKLTKYILGKNNVAKFWVEQLVAKYQKLPFKVESSGGSVVNKSVSEPVSEFFGLWTFLNQLLEASSRHANFQLSVFPGEKFHKYLTDLIMKDFINTVIVSEIFKKEPVQNIVAHSEYLAEMINEISTVDLVAGVIDAVLEFQRPDFHPRQIFGPRLVSKNEDLLISTLRLFESLLNTFHSSAVSRLVFSELGETAFEMSPQERTQKIDELLQLAASEKLVSATLVEESTHGFDDYFLLAQDLVDPVVAVHKSWPKDLPLMGSDETMNFLDILLSQFSRFFYNSPQKNLLLTKLLSTLALIPDQRITNWFLKQGEEGSALFNDLLWTLNQDSVDFARQIPNFEEKTRLIKRYCGDDMLLILHNLSLINPEESVKDFEQHLANVSNSPPQNYQSTLSSKASDDYPPFSIFLPAYLIFNEFVKEISAILLVIDRTMELQQGLERLLGK